MPDPTRDQRPLGDTLSNAQSVLTQARHTRDGAHRVYAHFKMSGHDLDPILREECRARAWAAYCAARDLLAELNAAYPGVIALAEIDAPAERPQEKIAV